MVLPDFEIMGRGIVDPCVRRTKAFGLTFGVGPAGYDVRIAEALTLDVGDFRLASTMEWFSMPDDVQGCVHDKSTWARRGLQVFNTIIDPGWRGYLTLELKNNGLGVIVIHVGMPIAQVVFHQLQAAARRPYDGKYQDQKAGPQPALYDQG